MIDRRVRAMFRKYKISGLAFISVLGLTSVLAVNLAGFLVLLPKPLWGLLDAGFVSGYFIRLSIFLAIAILASRYSVSLTSQVVGLIYGPLVVTSLLTKKAGRRLIRIKGLEAARDIAGKLLMRHDTEVENGNDNSLFEVFAKKVYTSKFARPLLGLTVIKARSQGRADARVEYFTIPIQLSVIVVVTSALFTSLTGSLLLVTLGILLFFIIPPTPSDIYFSKAYLQNGISIFSVLKFETWKMVNLQKFTLLVLTLSFASGILHHRSLVSEVGLLKFVGEVNVIGTMVLATSSGFIIYIAGGGYQFIPIEGTQIEVLPLTSETSN